MLKHLIQAALARRSSHRRSPYHCRPCRRSPWQPVLQDIRQYSAAVILCGLFLLLLELLLGKTCLLRILLGIPCPGCGLSRAALLLFSGHPAESIALHPFLLPLLFVLLLWIWEHYILDRPPRLFAISICLCFGGMFIFYLYRMKHCFPLVPPMTYDSKNLAHTLLSLLGFPF